MSDSNTPLALYPGGEAQYTFRMFVTYDQQIYCTTGDPRVVECVFNKVDIADRFDPMWQLRIRLGPVRSTEDIDEIGNMLKDDIFDRLSITLNMKIDRIRMTGHPLPMPGGASANLILPMMTISARGRTGCRELLADDALALQEVFTKSTPLLNHALVALYRSALATDDPVAKFLILYLILYEISVNQNNIDKLILTYAPLTIKTPSPKPSKDGKPQLEETIYTRLRNEMAHRIKAKPEEIRAEIILNLDAFQRIVYLALRSPDLGNKN